MAATRTLVFGQGSNRAWPTHTQRTDRRPIGDHGFDPTKSCAPSAEKTVSSARSVDL